MNGPLYWKGQLPVILLQLAAMVGLALLLLLGGMNGDSVALILLLWALVAALWLVRGYVLRKRQLEALLELARQLPEAYLLGEVMPAPTRADDQVFYHLLRQAGRSMLEQVSAVERERKEYKTYIQQWVHECKTPIAAGKLLCENHPSPLSQDLLPLWEAMDHYTEQALFYARSEHPEKDYLIRELPLFAPVHRAIAQNKYLLLQHQVRLEVLHPGPADHQRGEVPPPPAPPGAHLLRRPGAGGGHPLPPGQRHRHPPGGPAPDL